MKGTEVFKQTALGDAISQKDSVKVLDLISKGGLKEDESLFARLVEEMDRDVYMKALPYLGELSRDAVGLGVITALQKGDTGFVDMILVLNKNVNLDVVDRNDKTALMTAIENNELATCSSLIELGASLESQNQYGYTALMYATLDANPEAVELLINSGANVNAVDKSGATALTHATKGANLEIMSTLIENDADPVLAGVIEEKDNRAYVSESVQGAARDLLLEYIVEPEMYEMTPDELGLEVISALKENDLASAMLLINKRPDANLNLLDSEGKTVLMNALDQKNFNVADFLIKAGSALDTKDIDGKTALVRAVEDWDIEALGFLIEKGADVKEIDNDSIKDFIANSPNIVNGNPESLYFMLSKAIEFGMENNENLKLDEEKSNNTLAIAVVKGDIKAVRSLISMGANVNYKDADGMSPLMIASAYEHNDVVKFLLEEGAHIEDRDKEGDSALMYAALGGSAAVVSNLIKAGADFKAVDGQGKTCLMLAAVPGHFDIVRVLIEAGVDVNAKDSKGSTALAQAARNGRSEVMKELIAHKADPYIDMLVQNAKGEYEVKAEITGEARDVLLGYLAAEKEFKEKFADRMIAGIKEGEITLDNISDKVSRSIERVAKEDKSLGFAGAIEQKRLAALTPSVELDLVMKFIIAVGEALGIVSADKRAKMILDSVGAKLNEAMKVSSVFKPLSQSLEREVSTHAEKVRSSKPAQIGIE